MPKQLVFISGRINEMRLFREAAERAIAEAGMRHVFVDRKMIKPGVEVMRQMEEGVRSAHVFVGLYGFTLPELEGQDKHYLEREFQWALETGLPRLCYAPERPALEFAAFYDPPGMSFEQNMLKFRGEFLKYGIGGWLTTPEALYEDLLAQLKNALRPRVFVSYSSGDADFVKALVQRLTESGYRPWFNETNIAPGDAWEPELMKGLEETSVVVLVVSPNSMKSKWVGVEWKRFLESKKTVLQLIYSKTEVPSKLKAIQGIKVKDDGKWYFDLLREIEARQ